MRGLIGMLLVLMLLAGGGVLAFRAGLFSSGNGARHEAPERAPMIVSEETAETAAAKLERLRTERTPVRLSAPEITSLLRFGPGAWSLGGSYSPVVGFRGDTLDVTAAVETERLPPDPALSTVRLLLPDTTEVRISGTVHPLDERSLAFRITSAEVANMPIPPHYVPALLRRIGLPEQDGIDADAIAFPLPAEIASAEIADGDLVLTPLTP